MTPAHQRNALIGRFRSLWPNADPRSYDVALAQQAICPRCFQEPKDGHENHQPMAVLNNTLGCPVCKEQVPL